MPTYEYECKNCDCIIEVVSKVADMQDAVTCKRCGCKAKRIISLSVVQDDHPAWMTERLISSVCHDDSRRVDSRSELNAYCKQNGIVENPK